MSAMSARPEWSDGQWWEVHHRFVGSNMDKRVDRRRRTKASAERLASELRASGHFESVWLVEVNRFTRDRLGVAGNPRRARRG